MSGTGQLSAQMSSTDGAVATLCSCPGPSLLLSDISDVRDWSAVCTDGILMSKHDPDNTNREQTRTGSLHECPRFNGSKEIQSDNMTLIIY